jgi:hypothetical protein
MSFVSKAAQIGALSLLALAPARASLASVAPAGTTLYDSTGGTENGGDSFKSAGGILVDRIQTTTAETLLSVSLNLAKNNTRAGTFDVVLTRLGAGGKPVLRSVLATLSDANLTSSFALVNVNVAGNVQLKANTGYYIGIAHHPKVNSSVQFGNTLDPRVLARSSVVAGASYYNNGGAQANAGGPYEIQVVATP